MIPDLLQIGQRERTVTTWRVLGNVMEPSSFFNIPQLHWNQA